MAIPPDIPAKAGTVACVGLVSSRVYSVELQSAAEHERVALQEVGDLEFIDPAELKNHSGVLDFSKPWNTFAIGLVSLVGRC